MNVRNFLFAGLLATMSAFAVGTALSPAPAEAATCMLINGVWKCGGTDLDDAKSACNATTGNFTHKCDTGIDVCTCATERPPKQSTINSLKVEGGDKSRQQTR